MSKLTQAVEYALTKQLKPYQTRFVLDKSAYRIYVKSRQIGISFALAFDAWLDVFRCEPVGFVSRTQKQSTALLEKFYQWGRFFEKCGVPIKYEIQSRTECKVNGVDVYSLSSNAVGDEGFAFNVKLDEFALFQNDRQIYESLLPSITTGFRIALVSRPFGCNNLHHHIFHDVEKYPSYSRHRTTIYDAVADGFGVNVASLAEGFGGQQDEGFRENYLCEFIDESTAFLPYNLLGLCIGDVTDQDGEYYIGVDVGRYKDFTFAVIGKKVGEIIYVVDQEIMRNTPYHLQLSALSGKVKAYGVRAGLIDSTGLGNNLAEDLRRECYQIEGKTFTNTNKEEMAYNLKAALEQRRIVLPNDDLLLSDLHSVQRSQTSGNVVKLDAPRTGDGEHGNRFWAMALMITAAKSNMNGMNVSVIGLKDDGDDDDW